jgi:hypothetical protein
MTEGYVYVIQFDDLAIKVGWSANAANRINRHGIDAAKYGRTIIAFWSSDKCDAEAIEILMITYCRQAGTVRPGTKEYFTGLSFAACVAVAEGLNDMRSEIFGVLQEVYDDVRRRNDERAVRKQSQLRSIQREANRAERVAEGKRKRAERAERAKISSAEHVERAERAKITATRILNAIDGYDDQGARPIDLMGDLDLSKATIFRYLGQLSESGQIATKGRGWYVRI